MICTHENTRSIDQAGYLFECLSCGARRGSGGPWYNLANGGMMEAHLLGTKDFWQQMCRSGFVRLSLGCGVNGRDLFFVTIPPEHVPGFRTRVISDISNALNLGPLP